MCDGSHAGSGFGPRIFKATEDGFVAFCGCKRSVDATGKCDGTHSTF
jgi:CDGSH-type Zn-finger protein